MRRSKSSMMHWMTLAALAVSASAMAQNDPKRGANIAIDGSSTVAPIMMATAELFHQQNDKVRISVGISGTGGGFKKFLEDKAELRTAISDASRPIKPVEAERAAKLGVEFIELPIAYDGIAVVVNKANTFCDALTVDELKNIWAPGSTITNWKDVRSGFPDLALKLYGPGTDSGTFDYFTEAINGKEDASRSDYMPSEDDNVLVQGVKGDKGAMGYFGFAYYEANKDALRVLAIAGPGGKPPVKPSLESVRDGSYTPLSRPLFIYVNGEAARRPEVRQYVEFFLKNAARIVENPRVGYIALTPDLYDVARKRFADNQTGTAFKTPDAHHKPLTEVYAKKPQ